MNIKSALPTLLVSFGLLIGSLGAQPAPTKKTEAPAKTGVLVQVTQKEAAWAAKARESYPLQECVASGEKLGSMGETPQFIYRVDGKPDRLVVFCCEGCVDDFKSDPSKHIAKLDAAAAKKAGSGNKK
jgi:hypothetical protein